MPAETFVTPKMFQGACENFKISTTTSLLLIDDRKAYHNISIICHVYCCETEWVQNNGKCLELRKQGSSNS